MIIGLAGHIDHGKTALVRALTGVNTDRLKEEKARGITIDLGFAYTDFLDGRTIGFVDVPGHERLVHTMIAGACGIDSVLLVVAVDDGIMPQTREHFDIMRFLGVRRGVFALTKADLADATRRQQVTEEIRSLQASFSPQMEIVPVSVETGEGLTDLRAALGRLAAPSRDARSDRRLRFSVDRSFTLAGIGTVVSGFVASGNVRGGDEVCLASGLEARVRSIQMAGRPVPVAGPGERCALNLTGRRIRKDAIERGDWVLAPPAAWTSDRADIELCLAHHPGLMIKAWSPVLAHHGAAQIPGHLVPIERDELRAGESGLVQVVLDRPAPLRHGDHIVLRDAGCSRTIGGGTIVDPRAPRRGRRTIRRLAQLAAMHPADGAEALAALSRIAPGLVDMSAFAEDRDLPIEEAQDAARIADLAVLEADGRTFAIAPAADAILRAAVLAQLHAFHALEPTKSGLSLDGLRRGLREPLSRSALLSLLRAWSVEGHVLVERGEVRLPHHSTGLSETDSKTWSKTCHLLEIEPVPARLADIARTTGLHEAQVRQVFKRMARAGVLVEAAPDHFLPRATLVRMAEAAVSLSHRGQGFTVAEFRDTVGVGRNLAVAVLELFDRKRFTARSGDSRRALRDSCTLFAGAGS